MSDRPIFDPFAALAAAKAKAASRPTGKTFAELSQAPAELKTEENQCVSGNFAAFATFAGGLSRTSENSGVSDKRKKERFSLSFQGLTTEQSKPWLTPEARREAERATTPAKAAILRKTGLSLCSDSGNQESVAAKVLREFGRETALPPDPASSAAKVDQAAFDERAGFLEYDCGLSREAAEHRALAEAHAEATSPRPARDDLASWYAGLDHLDPERPPCQGYRVHEWPRTLTRARSFLDQFGEQAEALGWTAPRLFGAHPTAGIVRVDQCGALTLPIGGPVRAITATEIRFSHLTHREKPGQREGVPIWTLGR